MQLENKQVSVNGPAEKLEIDIPSLGWVEGKGGVKLSSKFIR